jgi:hypothetical protein
MTPPRSSPRIIAEKEKAQQAIDLRKAGATYEQIAAQLGYSSRQSACRAVARLLKAHTVEAVDDLRTLEDGRLDDMLRAIYGAAVGGDLATIDRILRIAERRAKLWGLDAPAKQEITGADGAPLSITIDK